MSDNFDAISELLEASKEHPAAGISARFLATDISEDFRRFLNQELRRANNWEDGRELFKAMIIILAGFYGALIDGIAAPGKQHELGDEGLKAFSQLYKDYLETADD